ncbi:MAG: GNAT family N-acetyltransferase [Limnochordaceae bacterium]|nr:GNAT family N-acetyltransferase [Limnochordaceae bacterium]
MNEAALAAIDDAWSRTGRRVRLRLLRESDLPKRLEMTNDPQVQIETLGMTVGERTPYDIRSWFKTLSHDPSSRQIAVEDAQGRYVGDFDLHSLDARQDEGWVEPFFGDKEVRDQGQQAVAHLLTDAFETLLAYLFDEMRLSRVMVECLSTHPVLLQVLHDLGFSDVGRIDHMNGVISHVMELRRDARRVPPTTLP